MTGVKFILISFLLCILSYIIVGCLVLVVNIIVELIKQLYFLIRGDKNE